MESESVNGNSAPKEDDIHKLINLVSLHIVEHPIENFDIHLAKLLDSDCDTDLLNSYKVRSRFINIYRFGYI